jgi:hypothetical protein
MGFEATWQEEGRTVIRKKSDRKSETPSPRRFFTQIGIDHQVKIACAVCNNELLSTFSKQAKPILSKLLPGDAAALKPL